MGHPPNAHLQRLLRDIEKQQAEDEKKLWSPEGILNIRNWYAQLIQTVKKALPKGNVKCLIITENEKGEISDVDYSYYLENELENEYLMFQINCKL